MTSAAAYVFLDEGGNFDFSGNGTEYFTLTSVSTRRPFAYEEELSALLYDLMEEGKDIPYFHASEDKQGTRDRVFNVITKHLDSLRIDSVIVRKRLTIAALRPPERFYPHILGYLLRHVLQGPELCNAGQVVVITDSLPVAAKRQAIAKGIQQTLPKMIGGSAKYRLFHRPSCACFGLQAADYCNWAIGRKWARADERSYSRIAAAVCSELDIFRDGPPKD